MRWVQPAGGFAGLREGLDGPASSTTTTDGGDNLAERIVKYVPAEVVAAFTMLFTALVGLDVGTKGPALAIGLIVLFLVVTVVYIIWKAPKGSVQTSHLIVSPLAFLAWSYPISSAMLADYFSAIVAFILQAIVIALSIFIVPKPS